MDKKFISSGILKRNFARVENRINHKELLVFGYAAKIFRDDVKALSIDKGKHLLDWDGEKIDRYDVRATLIDSNNLEPPPGGYGNRLDYLPKEEQRAEQLAEEERYYALHHNEQEEFIYQEEELKRLFNDKSSSTYGQVQYDYNATENEALNFGRDNTISNIEEDEKPFVPPENLEIPVYIDVPKTQNQHTIIEKTAFFINKQGSQMEILLKAKQSNNPKFEFLNHNSVLYPYYNFILKSIKSGNYLQYSSEKELNIANKDSNHDGNMENLSADPPQNISLISNNLPPILDITYKSLPSCSYTELVNKIKGTCPYKETNKVSLPESSGITLQEKDQRNQISETNQPVAELKQISSALMLAQVYSSDSDSEDESCKDLLERKSRFKDFKHVNPPERIKTIIDKTAMYVTKNGKQFEDTLISKNDLRFAFLNENDVYHEYYQEQLSKLSKIYSIDQTTQKKINPVSFSIKPKEDVNVPRTSVLSQDGSDEEHNNTTNCSKLSSTEFSGEQIIKNPQPKINENDKMKKTIPDIEVKLITEKTETFQSTSTEKQTVFSDLDMNIVNISVNDQVQPQSNLNHLKPTQYSPNAELGKHKEFKLAEEKIKDKLAQIAREKLGFISKEKQLQLERKRKAKVFLNSIKNSNKNNCVDRKIFETSKNDLVHFISTPKKNDEILNNNSDIEKSPQLEITILPKQNKNSSKFSEKLIDNAEYPISTKQTFNNSDNIHGKRTRSKSRSISIPRHRTLSRSPTPNSHKKKSRKDRQHSKKKSKKKTRSHSKSTMSSLTFPHKEKKHYKTKKHKRCTND